MAEKNYIQVGKDAFKMEDGKLVIASEQLANAIQNEGLELFVDEEAAVLSEGDKNGLWCC